MPAPDALDVIYSMMIDEGVGIDVPRHKVRERLDEVLNRPFDPEEALEYDRARWAAQNEAVARDQGYDLESDFEAAP